MRRSESHRVPAGAEPTADLRSPSARRALRSRGGATRPIGPVLSTGAAGLLAACLAGCGGSTAATTDSAHVVQRVRTSTATELEANREPALPPPKIHEHTSPNGLRILFVETGAWPLGRMRAVSRRPKLAREESPETRAIMATLLLDDNLRHSRAQLTRSLDDALARMSSWSEEASTNVTISFPTQRLDKAARLLGDVLAKPAFKEGPIAGLAARAAREGAPETKHALQGLEDVMLGAPPKPAAPAAGEEPAEPEPEPVDAGRITQNDVFRAYRSEVDPLTTTLIVVGAFEPTQLFERLDRSSLGTWWGELTVPRPPQDVQPRTSPRLVVIDHPGAKTTELAFGLVGPVEGNVRAFLRAVEVLDARRRLRGPGAPSAPLRVRLRQSPLMLEIAGTVTTDHTREAILEVVSDLKGIGEFRATDDELASQERPRLTRGFEATKDLTAALAGLVLSEPTLPDLGEPEPRDADDVRRIGSQYFDPQHLAVVVAGDHAALRSALADLGLGTVELLEASAK